MKSSKRYAGPLPIRSECIILMLLIIMVIHTPT
jgi:hypothetical protein